MDAFFVVLTGVLAIFALLAVTLGVDSRDFSIDPQRPEHPAGLSI